MPAEIQNCPKGWGRVIFKESGSCPLSGTVSCKECKAGALNEHYESAWKKLKQEKTE